MALLLALFGAGKAAQAQGIGGATEHVEWTVAAQPQAVAPGDTVRLTFEAAIGEGWKMYAVDSPPPSRGVSVRFDEVPAALTQAGVLTQAEPKEGYDPNFDKTVRYFEERASLEAAFAVDKRAEVGPRTVGGTVEFMICTDRLCLPPTRVPFEAAVQVREGAAGASEGTSAAGATPAEAVPNLSEEAASEREAFTPEEEAVEGGERSTSVAAPSSTGALDAARAGGLWGFLLLAAGAGAAALLTPCVFPMIPLTVSYFTKHTGTRREAARMAGVYGLTIVLTFTGLGALAAVLVGAAGAQTIAANPWVNLFIGGVFVVFALSLLGLFELRLPSGLVNYFNRQSDEHGGYLGVLFMGLTLTLVSFSCTAPFVGGLLAATTGGAWTYPIIGMLVFSAVFALPFIAFAMFPRGLSALPKSGSWMNAVKVTLGFIELAAALKFLSNADLVWGTNILSRPLAIALSVVIFFLTGLYLLGKLRLKHEPTVEEIGVARLLAAMAFFGLSLYMLPGLLGAPLGALDAYLPPRQASDVSLLAALPRDGGGSQDERFEWHTNDIDAAFAEAQAEGKPVFIDFTGYTCTNCRDMEANVFPQPEVARRFEDDFVLLRLFTDDPNDGPDLQRYQLKLTGTTALPTYAIVQPESRRLIDRISGVTKPDRFVDFLEAGAASFGEKRLAAAVR